MKVWAVIVAIEDYPNVIGGVAQKLPGPMMLPRCFGTG